MILLIEFQPDNISLKYGTHAQQPQIYILCNISFFFPVQWIDCDQTILADIIKLIEIVWEHLLKALQHVMISAIIGGNIFAKEADSLVILVHLMPLKHVAKTAGWMIYTS